MRKILVLSGLMALTISFSLFAQQASILIVKGEVSVGSEIKGWKQAKAGEVVQVQENIRCGADGEISLALGGSIIHLDAGSEAQISEFLEEEGTEKVRISLLVGLVTTKVKKLLKNEFFEVETPTAVVGVRGTEFSVSLSEDEVGVDVLEGEVDFMDRRDRAKMIRLKRDERVRLKAQARFPERVEKMNPDQKKRISEKMGKIRNIQKQHLKKRMEMKRKIQKKRVKRSI